MKKLLCILFILVPIFSFSQTIKGKVLDENKQPLAGANIYFDGTTIATIADENGNFNLYFGAKLNSLLVISYIGFETQFINLSEVNKELHIALKEANETSYWLMLLKDTGFITNKEFDSIIIDADELIKMLVSIVKTTKSKLGK